MQEKHKTFNFNTLRHLQFEETRGMRGFRDELLFSNEFTARSIVFQYQACQLIVVKDASHWMDNVQVMQPFEGIKLHAGILQCSIRR